MDRLEGSGDGMGAQGASAEDADPAITCDDHATPRAATSASRRDGTCLVLQELLSHGPLSRIELSRSTGIAPSSMTSIVGRLVADGVVEELPDRVCTAGRSRAPLGIRGDRGTIGVIEVTRGWTRLTLYDLALAPLASLPLFEGAPDGERILATVAPALAGWRTQAQGDPARGGAATGAHGALCGLGVLLGPDVTSGELACLYSTGFAAERISLTNALFTAYRVPVIERRSQECALRQTYRTAPVAAGLPANHLDLEIGRRVLAAVVQDDALVPVAGEGGHADVTSLVTDRDGVSLARLCALITTIRTLFTLQAVFVSAPEEAQDLLARLREWGRRELGGVSVVTRAWGQGPGDDGRAVIADAVRRRALVGAT